MALTRLPCAVRTVAHLRGDQRPFDAVCVPLHRLQVAIFKPILFEKHNIGHRTRHTGDENIFLNMDELCGHGDFHKNVR